MMNENQMQRQPDFFKGIQANCKLHILALVPSAQVFDFAYQNFAVGSQETCIPKKFADLNIPYVCNYFCSVAN